MSKSMQKLTHFFQIKLGQALQKCSMKEKTQKKKITIKI